MADNKDRSVVNSDLIGGLDDGKVSVDVALLNIATIENAKIASEKNIQRATKVINEEWYKEQEQRIKKKHTDATLAAHEIAKLRKNHDKNIAEMAQKMQLAQYKQASALIKKQMVEEQQKTILKTKNLLTERKIEIANSNIHGNSKNAQLRKIREQERKIGQDALEYEKRRRALGKQVIQEKRRDGATTRKEMDEALDAINKSFELQEEQHAANIDNINEQMALLDSKRDKEGNLGKKDQEEYDKLEKAKEAEQGNLKETKQQHLKEGTMANMMKGVTHALNEGLKGLSDALNKSVDEAIDTVGKYKSFVDARLQDTDSNYNDVAKTLKRTLGVSPLAKQKDVLEQLKNAVDKGIAYNVEQRAFLATMTDKIVSTFDAFDSNLMRIIRLQQADTTQARMGMEAELLQFFNRTFQDNSYLQEGYDEVSKALIDANANMSRDMSIAFEYNVQKWLGSLASLGFGTDTITTIAQGINYLGSGNVQALAGNTQLQSLLAMSAVRGGLDYSDLLINGITDKEVNTLLKSMVEYLAEIAEDENKVVKAAYGDVFNFTQSDLQAVRNLVNDKGATLANISNESMTYKEATKETQMQLIQVLGRLSATEMVNNAFDNFTYTAGESLASDPISALTWKTISLIEEATGGIHLPAISVMGNMIDLSTFTIEGIMKTGMFGLSVLGNIPSMIGSMASGGGLNLNAWGFDEYTKRGGASTEDPDKKGVQSSLSVSKAQTSSSSSDTKKAAISDTEEDQESSKESAEQMNEEHKNVEDLYNALFEDKKPVYTLDVPVLTAMTVVVSAVNTMKDRTVDIYKLLYDKDKSVNVNVTNMSDMSTALAILAPKDTVKVDSVSINDLVNQLSSKLLGSTNTDGSYADGNATIADIANILVNGTLRVTDVGVAEKLEDLNKNLY